MGKGSLGTCTRCTWGGGYTSELQAHFDNIDVGLILARGLQDSATALARPTWGVSNSFSFTSMMTGHDVFRYVRGGGRLVDAFNDRPFMVTCDSGFDSPADLPIGIQYSAELFSTFWGYSDLRTAGRLEGEVTIYLRHDRNFADIEGGRNPEPLWSIVGPRTTAMGLGMRPFDVHSARFVWTGYGARVHGFFNTGRGPWTYSGDFFNFALEAWDTHTPTIWNIKSPMGVEFTHSFGRGQHDGLRILAGPRVFMGANPQVIALWSDSLEVGEGGLFRYSVAVSQEMGTYNPDLPADFDQRASGRASLWALWSPRLDNTRSFSAELGLMIANWHKIDDFWNVWTDPLDMDTISTANRIDILDTLSARARINFSPIQHFNFTGEFIYAGLVADTNWRPNHIGTIFTDIGTGNRIEGRGGINANHGPFAVWLNALYRQPLVGPSLGNTGWANSNPFRVGANRETLAFEFVFAFDPQPASWIWWWNNPDTEGARFATSLVARYNVFQGATDPSLWNDDGPILFSPRGFNRVYGTYSIGWRKFVNPNNYFRIVNTATFLSTNPNHNIVPDHERGELMTGWSNFLQLRYRRLVFGGSIAQNLWGGPGYEVDWNFVFPWRWGVELAFSFIPNPSLMASTNRVGLRWNGATRDERSHDAWGAWCAATERPLSGMDTNELVLFFNISF